MLAGATVATPTNAANTTATAQASLTLTSALRANRITDFMRRAFYQNPGGARRSKHCPATPRTIMATGFQELINSSIGTIHNSTLRLAGLPFSPGLFGSM